MISDETVSRIRSGDAIALVWSVGDVLDVTTDESDLDTLSVEQAREVLAHVLNNHDASIGVSWDTIMEAADELFPDRSADN